MLSLASALQSFQLGAGHPTKVANWTRSMPMPTRHTSDVIMNLDCHKAWRIDGPTQGKCIWQMHNVWGWDETKNVGVVLRESYFNKNPKTGKKVFVYVTLTLITSPSCLRLD